MKGVSLTESREYQLDGPMYPLGDPITLQMVGRCVEQFDMMFMAKLLELCAGELSIVVQHDATQCPVVCHVLP